MNPGLLAASGLQIRWVSINIAVDLSPPFKLSPYSPQFIIGFLRGGVSKVEGVFLGNPEDSG